MIEGKRVGPKSEERAACRSVAIPCSIMEGGPIREKWIGAVDRCPCLDLVEEL